MKNAVVKIILFLLLSMPCLGWESNVPAPSKGSIPGATYFCQQTAEPIRIDGELDEPAWQKAPVLGFFFPVSYEKPLSPTEGRLLWDDQYLYVAFSAADKDIGGELTKRDSPTCLEDVLEVFLQPDPQKGSYCNFEINALETIYDAYCPDPAQKRNFAREKLWNCRDLTVKAKIEGTLNKKEDIDKRWQMEIAIPFSAIPSLEGRPPSPGDQWRFHLARYDYSVYLPDGKELTSTARLSRLNFHLYSDWSPLQFSGLPGAGQE